MYRTGAAVVSTITSLKELNQPCVEYLEKKIYIFTFEEYPPFPLPNPNTHIKNKITFALHVQGAPKVHSSNFLRYNFLIGSKLYF